MLTIAPGTWPRAAYSRCSANICSVNNEEKEKGGASGGAVCTGVTLKFPADLKTDGWN